MDRTPEPSRPLQEAGLVAWQNAWREAGAWLAAADHDAVLTYAEAVDDYVHLREFLHQQGFDGVSLWRERKQMIDMAKQLKQLRGDLGLSPVSRSHLGVAEVRVAEVAASLMNRSDMSRPFTIGIDEQADGH